MLLQQGYQGSLEPNTIPKFVRASVDYKGMTGKSGSRAFSEMMAIANVVKDEAGTGRISRAPRPRPRTRSPCSEPGRPEKRAMLGEGLLVRRCSTREGHVDFLSRPRFWASAWKRTRPSSQDMATFSERLQRARPERHRCGRGQEQGGTAKALDKLANPDVAAALPRSMKGTWPCGTRLGPGTISDNESLGLLPRSRKNASALADVRNAANENLTPEGPSAEEVGGLPRARPKQRATLARHGAGSLPCSGEKMGLISSDP